LIFCIHFFTMKGMEIQKNVSPDMINAKLAYARLIEQQLPNSDIKKKIAHHYLSLKKLKEMEIKYTPVFTSTKSDFKECPTVQQIKLHYSHTGDYYLEHII